MKRGFLAVCVCKKIVDVSVLPKQLGGNAVSVDENGEEDERCTRGVEKPSLSAFLRGLEDSYI